MKLMQTRLINTLHGSNTNRIKGIKAISLDPSGLSFARIQGTHTYPAHTWRKQAKICCAINSYHVQFISRVYFFLLLWSLLLNNILGVLTVVYGSTMESYIRLTGEPKRSACERCLDFTCQMLSLHFVSLHWNDSRLLHKLYYEQINQTNSDTNIFPCEPFITSRHVQNTNFVFFFSCGRIKISLI